MDMKTFALVDWLKGHNKTGILCRSKEENRALLESICKRTVSRVLNIFFAIQCGFSFYAMRGRVPILVPIQLISSDQQQLGLEP